MLILRYEAHEPRTSACTLKWRRTHTAVHRFDLRLAQNKGLDDSMPADCLVQVVERNLDDTEAEFLNPAKKERISIRLEPAVGQRSEGIHPKAVEQDQDRQAL